MESLTKENFWNELKEKFPLSMGIFCKWIDEYKLRIDWDSLFSNFNRPNGPNDWREKIKYHDLPIAMQLGIFFEFLASGKTEHGLEFCDLDWERIPEIISDWFDSEEQCLNIK